MKQTSRQWTKRDMIWYQSKKLSKRNSLNLSVREIFLNKGYIFLKYWFLTFFCLAFFLICFFFSYSLGINQFNSLVQKGKENKQLNYSGPDYQVLPQYTKPPITFFPTITFTPANPSMQLISWKWFSSLTDFLSILPLKVLFLCFYYLYCFVFNLFI